uniref:Autophagy-related protein 2 n=1 Tax=Anopheles minimus TaxID=112268 RepID=A0A182W0F8_9DIPT
MNRGAVRFAISHGRTSCVIMPWYAPWSDVIKKKICRFLLQRYLGRFLEEKLTLDQLNVDFYNGTGTVHNVTLYCQVSKRKGG